MLPQNRQKLRVQPGSGGSGPSVLFWLESNWNERNHLLHAYFLPPLAIWLVWRQRREIGSAIGQPSWLGLLLLAPTIVGHLMQDTLWKKVVLFAAAMPLAVAANAVRDPAGGVGAKGLFTDKP